MLLASALSRVNGLAATFDSLEKNCYLVKINNDEPIVREMIAVETQRTESEIIDTLDELDGEALTRTLRALDEVRYARDALLPVSQEAAVRAKRHARQAVSALSSAIDIINVTQRVGSPASFVKADRLALSTPPGAAT
jgi:hypothetical protein